MTSNNMTMCRVPWHDGTTRLVPEGTVVESNGESGATMAVYACRDGYAYAANASARYPWRGATVLRVLGTAPEPPHAGSPTPAPSSDVLAEVKEERARQDAKWGQQDHPDADPVLLGRSGGVDRALLAETHDIPTGARAERKCQTYESRGQTNWLAILVEEVGEASDEIANGSTAELRGELVQVAAVATAWVEAIDRREEHAGIDPESITEWTWCLVRVGDGREVVRQVCRGRYRQGEQGMVFPFPEDCTIVTDDVRIGGGHA